MEAAQKAGPEKGKMHKLRRVHIVRKRRIHTTKQTVFLTLLNSKNSPRFNSPLNCVPQRHVAVQWDPEMTEKH